MAYPDGIELSWADGRGASVPDREGIDDVGFLGAPVVGAASYTGTAPIEAFSGDVIRHRLSRAGDRRLNFCLHVMALTQVRQNASGRTCYLKKRSEGKGHKEAMRCLKRRLSDAVYRQLRRDANLDDGRPATTPGNDS